MASWPGFEATAPTATEVIPHAHADDQAELHAILDSIRIGTEADQP